MNVIYVDDEKPALDNFQWTVKDFTEIGSLKLFQRGEEALEWAREYPVDTAFLDMEMQGLHGLELAKALKELDRNIRIVFVTAFGQYALDAFGVDAVGYILKPYSRQEVYKELEKAARVRPFWSKKVVIQTIPNFAVSVDGEVLTLGRAKTEELLALLVDRGSAGVTSGEAIACLWPDRADNEATQSLYRMTFKRLLDALKDVGIEFIIHSAGRKKRILTDRVECDLYRILDGDTGAIQYYGGGYLSEYSWAEERNAQLNSIKAALEQKNP